MTGHRLTRREVLGGAAGCFATAGAATVDGGFAVAPGVRQLFLDDVGIERLEGLRRVVNPPRRHPANPLIRPDTAWERGCQVYGTALYDAQARRFKMWYLTGPKDRGLKPLVVNGRERPPHTTLVGYAESRDGVKWVKPDLGLFPYDGDTRNNLVPLGFHNCEGVAILHEPHDPDPEKRFKAFFWDHGTGGWEVRNGAPFAIAGPNDGLGVAFSRDGLRWKHHEGNPVIRKYSDTNQVVLFDPALRKYVAYGRFGFGRRLARSESADFLRWSDPQLVLECDAADGPGTQIYGAGIDLYEGVYLGMLWVYREGGDAKIDTQLVTSRDGIRWTRVGDRAVWLALGPDDTWEGGMVRSVERIIRRDDQLYIYYCGVHGPHGRPGHPRVERKFPVMIGLVTQRRDGFVSLDAGNAAGSMVTRPFPLPPGALHVNVDATGGEVTAQMLDREGTALAPPALLRGDHLAARLAVGRGGVRVGTPVRLRLTARNARLYSYWFSRDA
jgi:hypothetical protein